MILQVSLALLALAFVVAVFTRTLLPRVCIGTSLLVWAAYLLYFQFEGLARVVARQPPEHPLADNPYVIGVIAYKDALIELRLSIAIIVIAFTILAVIRRCGSRP